MKKVILSLASVLAATVITPEAMAIPSFSRQASVSCKACHSQHAPILNGFGQAFKAGGYPMMGTQGKVEGDDLSIPNTLNASMLLKARYQKTNGANTDVIPGDTTNSGQWQVPQEFSLFFGGRIAETIGFFFEGNTAAPNLIANFKLPAALYVADAKFSVIPYMTNALGASYGYEQSSTGAVRNIHWAEHHKETSAQQYIGTDTAATGVAMVAQNDNGYINLSRWAPAFMARNGAAQTLRSSYLRIAATPTVSTTTKGDWALHIGAQFWRGSNYAYDSLSSLGLVPVNTSATALDFQAFGQVNGKDLGIYATWARASEGSAAQPNIFNVGNQDTNPPGSAEPTLYRLNERKAWTIGAEYSVKPNLHVGAAYRRANTGGLTGVSAIAGDNPSDNAITLTGVYNITQNIEFHLNHSFYSGTFYTTPQSTTGNLLTSFMLLAAW
ncbi:MAG: hypothetical protein WAW75_02830 [Gallionella sp.]